jgi:adenylosuccinate synthase
MANATIVAGLGYGDEGKGAVVSFLTEQLRAKLVVRFNGGAQAAHNVVAPDGRHHTFAQFGSGTFSGVPTLLSRHVLVNPGSLINEASHLGSLGISDPLSLVNVEEDALVTTPFQMAVNRIKEIWRGGGRHGSCGMGIFETIQDSIDRSDLAVHAGDLRNPKSLRERLERLRCYKMLGAHEMIHEMGTSNEQASREWELLCDLEAVDGILDRWAYFPNKVKIVDRSWLAEQLWQPGEVLFEGAQGILLDEDWGFFPYATRSKTGFTNAMALLGDCTGKATRIGVLRSHMTRHGAGPLVTEDPGAASLAAGDHNKFGPWQQSFRVGWLDLVALKYAREVSEPDVLAISHLDMPGDELVCTAYDFPGEPDPDLFEVDREVVKSILIKPTSLPRQGKLTEALHRMRPLYGAVASGSRLTKIIEDKLGSPVRIVGRGQSWKDWTELPGGTP